MQRPLRHFDPGDRSSAGSRHYANSFMGDRAQRRILRGVRRHCRRACIASAEQAVAHEFYLLLLIRDSYGILFDKAAMRTNDGDLQGLEPGSGIPETITPMLWSASLTGEVTHISSRVREYSGLTLEDFANFGWSRFIHPDDLEDTAKAFGHAIQTGESYIATHRLRRANGEYRWHQAMGEPLRDPTGKIVHWYGLSIDIDERKRAEDYLRDMRAKLSRASRIATAAELSASIAHELNQPLMAIIANAQAARQWLTASQPNFPEVNTSIERVLRDAQAAAETLRHIRALFKQDSFDKSRANIADIIREAVRFVHEDPKKREVPIDLRFEDPLPAVSVDAIQIQQLFINLLSNAIEAQDGRPAHPLVEVAAVTTDRNEIIVQVIDNGPGLEDTERIFDAFVTTKANGMGVGLAVSRSIAEAHDGRLWAENCPDGGARFNLALPLSAIDGDPASVHLGRKDLQGGLSLPEYSLADNAVLSKRSDRDSVASDSLSGGSWKERQSSMYSYDAKCLDLVARTMKVLRGKWTVQVLCALLNGPVRLSQLRRLIPTASKKALTANLRSLEKVNLIVRRDLSSSVLHVEYEIAELARAPLAALVDQLSRFQKYLPGPA